MPVMIFIYRVFTVCTKCHVIQHAISVNLPKSHSDRFALSHAPIIAHFKKPLISGALLQVIAVLVISAYKRDIVHMIKYENTFHCIELSLMSPRYDSVNCLLTALSYGNLA